MEPHSAIVDEVIRESISTGRVVRLLELVPGVRAELDIVCSGSHTCGRCTEYWGLPGWTVQLYAIGGTGRVLR